MKTKDLQNLSDNEILQKFKAEGSSVYFEVLFERYYPRVLDKCFSLVKKRDLAEELAEEVFEKAFEKLSGFRQLSSFSTWLYSITYNHCIDYLRKKKNLHYPNWNRENEIPEIVDEPGEDLDSMRYENLMKVMELIHPEEKALVLMKYQDNLSMKQIATALRITEDAAKMRLKRARTRLLFLYNQKYLKE